MSCDELDRREKKGDELTDEYGKIMSVTIDGYYKYTFYLTVKTEKGYTIRVTAGGSSHDIYRFDPHDTTWGEVAYFDLFYYDVLSVP